MIEAVQLTKKFGNHAALDAVSFQIEDGSIYGLVGSNGSGKSTLLRLIAGVYYPDGGNIIVDSMSTWNNPELKSKIFFLADTPHFFKNANLKEMADFYESMYPTFNRERFGYLTGVFPISLTDKIDNMSKGMQRQAALMLALSVEPKYLLLDEAFDGLDPVIRGVLKALLLDGAEQTGMTTVISSHNLRELEDLCDHVGLLHKGHVVFSDHIDLLRGGIHKVQAAFKVVPPEIKFGGLHILKAERTGSLLQMVVRGSEEEIMQKINALDPLFAEIIEPSLEEIFIYELEVEGYDLQDILK